MATYRPGESPEVTANVSGTTFRTTQDRLRALRSRADRNPADTERLLRKDAAGKLRPTGTAGTRVVTVGSDGSGGKQDGTAVETSGTGGRTIDATSLPSEVGGVGASGAAVAAGAAILVGWAVLGGG